MAPLVLSGGEGEGVLVVEGGGSWAGRKLMFCDVMSSSVV